MSHSGPSSYERGIIFLQSYREEGKYDSEAAATAKEACLMHGDARWKEAQNPPSVVKHLSGIIPCARRGERAEETAIRKNELRCSERYERELCRLGPDAATITGADPDLTDMQDCIRAADKTALDIHLEVNFARVARTSRRFNTAFFIAPQVISQRSFKACWLGCHVQKKEEQSNSSPRIRYRTSEKYDTPREIS